MQDVLGVTKTRGGRGWPSASQQQATANRQSRDESHDTHLHDRGRQWSNTVQQKEDEVDKRRAKALLETAEARTDDAAFSLQRTFEKLLHRAQAVSDGCRDEMQKLSNESVVREGQRGKERAEAMTKVTFIAAVFVPLSFTTSIFGMDIQQINGSGPELGIRVAVVVSVMVISVVAWAVNGEFLERARCWLRSLKMKTAKKDLHEKGKEGV